MKKKLIIFIIIYFIFSTINLINYPELFVKQLIWYIVGIIIIIFMKRKYLKYTFPLYILFNIFLLYLLIFGNVINGSKAWINIMGFSFQPSEFMKIILIVLLSMVALTEKKYKLKCFIITLIPSILTFLEPDTGNVIFYFIIFFSVIFYKEEKYNKIIKYLSIIIFFIIILVFFYIFNNELLINILGESIIYRMDRILSLINNESFQLQRSLINIGTSSIFGSNTYLYIPFETTDFAFAYLIHHIGYVGIIIFLIFNAYFNFNLLKISKNSDAFISIISFVSLILKFAQESIHELMGIGYFPITGITLPLVSYGGSSIISFIIIFSIIYSKDNHNKDILPYKGLRDS